MRVEHLCSQGCERLKRLILRKPKQDMNEFLPRAHPSVFLSWYDSQMRPVMTKRPARDQILFNLFVPFAAYVRLDFTGGSEYCSLRNQKLSREVEWLDSKMVSWEKLKLLISNLSSSDEEAMRSRFRSACKHLGRFFVVLFVPPLKGGKMHFWWTLPSFSNWK